MGGNFEVRDNEYLHSIALPALQAVGGDVAFGPWKMNVHSKSNLNLKSFSLPALTQVGGDLSVVEHPVLTSFSLGAITDEFFTELMQEPSSPPRWRT